MKARTARALIGAGCVVALLGAPSRASAGVVVYEQDFETRSLGSEWSSSLLSFSDAFSSFAGRYTNDTLTLTLTGVESGAPHTLVFDLYVIDGWNGAHPVFGGQRFGVSIDGEAAFEHTFSNGGNRRAGAFAQTYPDDPTVEGALGFDRKRTDSIYRDVTIEMDGAGEAYVISFFGKGLRRVDEASWGIDNVRVVAPVFAAASIPAPGAVVCFGVLILTAPARRRR